MRRAVPRTRGCGTSDSNLGDDLMNGDEPDAQGMLDINSLAMASRSAHRGSLYSPHRLPLEHVVASHSLADASDIVYTCVMKPEDPLRLGAAEMCVTKRRN